jgi:hypothetical protein
MESLMQTQKSKTVNLAIALFVTLLPWSHLAEAQQPEKTARIGLLGGMPLRPLRSGWKYFAGSSGNWVT